MASAWSIEEENDLNHSVSVKELKDILECPVCLIPPTSGPVYRCENGHLLCNQCRDKVETCPECRVQLGVLRCLTSEKITTIILQVHISYELFRSTKYLLNIRYLISEKI